MTAPRADAPPRGSREAQSRLRIATYNIHGCIGGDRRYDPARIGRVIRQLNADAIALQEVDSGYKSSDSFRQIEDIARETGMRAVAAPTLQNDRGHFGNALLTRRPLQAQRIFPLSGGKNREPRCALEAELLFDRETVRLVVTHFSTNFFDRRRQVRALLHELDVEGEDLLIAAGDFNEWTPHPLALGELRARFGQTPAPRSFPARFPLFRLDRIWVRPRSALLSIEAVRDGEASIASDHLPVVATIRTLSESKGSSKPSG